MPRVSVVIPVYNPGPYLRECLDSLVAQDLAPGELEVVAVDDGSTDGSGAVLDEYAARHPGFRVLHQENSGWPGRPRNRGLAEATGTYVLFMDADDRLGPEALRRLADFADAHGSDIVVPRMVTLGHRYLPVRIFETTQVDADIVEAFRTLSPQKLFRRSFLEAHELRFPEERVRLEDGMFLARAYLAASRVSVLADYDHYVLRTREDGGNLSARSLGDPEHYIRSVGTVIDIVREHAPTQAVADDVSLDIYRRKGLKHFHPEKFFEQRPKRLRAWLAAAGELARTRIPPELEHRLPLNYRLRSRFVRHGDLRALRAVVQHQRDGDPPRAAYRDGRVLLAIPHTGHPGTLDVTADVPLELRVRSLRHRGDRVDVRGEARLGGVAVRTLPLTFTATAGEDAVSAEADVAAPRDGWHPFSARVPLPRADGSEAVQLSAAVGVAPEVTAELPGLPPAAGARPPLRSRVGTRALLDAGDRLSRHPVVLPARRRAIALVRERSGVRAVYRRLRRAGRA